MLLQFLLPALPDEYAVTVATLDAQPNLSVQDKLVALRNREDVVRVAKAIEDKALASKDSAVPKQDKDDDTGAKCDFCKRRPHTKDKCPFQKAFDEIIRAVTRRQTRYPSNNRRSDSRKSNYGRYDRTDRPNGRTSNSTDRKDRKRPAKGKGKQEHSYIAQDDSTDELTDNYSTTDLSDDDNQVVEYAYITRDKIRKVPYSS